MQLKMDEFRKISKLTRTQVKKNIHHNTRKQKVLPPPKKITTTKKIKFSLIYKHKLGRYLNLLLGL